MTTRQQITDLLERVEGATGASFDLFVRIVRACGVYDDMDARFWDLLRAGAYTDAALALLARVLPGRVVRLSISERVSTAQLTSPLRDDGARHAGSTPALAILSAMLRALIAEMTDE